MQFFLILVMIFVTYVLDDGSYLLPVVGSLAFGCWSGSDWSYTKPVFVALMVLAALTGVTFARVAPECPNTAMLVVYIVTGFYLAASHSHLPPLFAVSLMPVFLHKTDFLYVGVVAVYALIIVWGQWLRESRHEITIVAIPKRDMEPTHVMMGYLLQLAAMLPLLVVSEVSKNAYFMMPCLFVILDELCGSNPLTDSQEDAIWTQVAFAALLGVAADGLAMYLIDVRIIPHYPAIVALTYVSMAGVVLALFTFIKKSFGYLFLPAVSFLLFPFLRDGSIGYPLAVDVSTFYLIIVATRYERLPFFKVG